MGRKTGSEVASRTHRENAMCANGGGGGGRENARTTGRQNARTRERQVAGNEPGRVLLPLRAYVERGSSETLLMVFIIRHLSPLSRAGSLSRERENATGLGRSVGPDGRENEW